MAAAQVSSWSATARNSAELPAVYVHGAWIMSMAFSAISTVSPAMAIKLAQLKAMPSTAVVTCALWRLMAL